MEHAFFIEGSRYPRPHSLHTIYVDGTAGSAFRTEADIELSHWTPNRTLDKYKAGTSTEICFKFLDDPARSSYDLVINNHLDVDGLLSVFVLVHPQLAHHHRKEICEAAEAGDFWAWAEGKSWHLFHELCAYIKQLDSPQLDPYDAYLSCFNRVIEILESKTDFPKAHPLLEKQWQLVETGLIHRNVLADHLVSYFVPKNLITTNLEQYLNLPSFSEPLSDRLAFWPQVRNRLDHDKLQLVSIESDQGRYYELWAPGYLWADTKGLWTPPVGHEGENRFLMWDKLEQIVEQLNTLEQGPAHWTLFTNLNLLGVTNPRKFPILVSVLNDKNQAAVSTLTIEEIHAIFALLFQDHTTNKKTKVK